ncbi:MAG: dihydrofolate reductase [Candidatus Saccharibacteria bacterium]
MKTIVAVDENWGIGCNGQLLQRLPEDMKFFKEKTLGKVVVMGMETFLSLPKQEPLVDRINIVLSNDDSFTNEKVIICRSLAELFEALKKYPTEDVFIIGGESVYTQMLPYCSEAYITKIMNSYTADKHFPNLDKLDEWELVSTGETKSHDVIQFVFTTYINSAPKAID